MFASYLCMIILSVAAFILPYNGHKTAGISEIYLILTFPSKYIFIVVVFIYMSLLYWFYKQWQMVRQQKFTISPIQVFFFITSMVLQLAWIFYWHHEQFIISFVLLVISTLCVTALYMLMPPINKWSDRLPFSIYFAWQLILLMLNIAVILVHYSIDVFGLSQPLLTVILMTGFVAVALHIRFHHYDPAFPIIFIWVFIGIITKNSFDELLVSTAALFLIGVLLTGILFMNKKKRTIY